MIPLFAVALATAYAIGRWRALAQRDQLASDLQAERAVNERLQGALKVSARDVADARQAAADWQQRAERFETVARQQELEHARGQWRRSKAT